MNRALDVLRHKSAQRLASAATRNSQARNHSCYSVTRAVEVTRRADLCRSHWSGRFVAGSRVLTARREAGFPLQ